MAKEISEERQKDYRQTFDMFDNNKSGKIDKKELGNVMRQLGKNPSETDLETLVKEVDADGDGEIDFNEFLTMMAESENSEIDEIKTAFAIFDKDGNGYISKDELKAVMVSLGERVTDADIDIMMKGADQNGDGKVSFDEFTVMMRGGGK